MSSGVKWVCCDQNDLLSHAFVMKNLDYFNNGYNVVSM